MRALMWFLGGGLLGFGAILLVALLLQPGSQPAAALVVGTMVALGALFSLIASDSNYWRTRGRDS